GQVVAALPQHLNHCLRDGVAEGNEALAAAEGDQIADMTSGPGHKCAPERIRTDLRMMDSTFAAYRSASAFMTSIALFRAMWSVAESRGATNAHLLCVPKTSSEYDAVMESPKLAG